MKNKSLLIFSLFGFLLTGCKVPQEPVGPGPDEEKPEPVTPVQLAKEDLIQLLRSEYKSQNKSYRFSDRAYLDNFLDGSVRKNENEVTEYNIFSNGIDGKKTFYTLEKPLDTVSENFDSGRYAVYLDGENYIQGFLSSDATSSNNYLSYHENNMYISFDSFSNPDKVLLGDVIKGFETPNELWNTEIGFEHGEFEVEQLEDKFVYKMSAFAPEQDYYSHEIGEVKVEVSLDAKTVLGYEFLVCVFDPGFSEDINLHVNNLSLTRVDNMVKGELAETTIAPFDVSKFADEFVYNRPHVAVQNVPEGNLSEENIINIAKNIKAYSKDTKECKAEIYEPYYYNENFEDLGPAKQTGTVTRYNDFVKTIDLVVEFDDKSLPNQNIKTVARAEERGVVNKTQQDDGEVFEMVTEPLYVSSLEEIFNPSPLISDFNLSSAIKILSSGIGTFEDEYGSVTEVSLNKGVKTGNKIELDFDVITYETVNVKLTIEDDFLTYATYITSNGVSGTFNCTKGEFDKYTGTL